MADFARPLTLQQASDGWLERVCWLGPGVYAYKFRMADGEWLLDPLNPRTRAVDGVRNSVVVVEGASEPLLHAPASPWVYLEDDGRLVIRAGLRLGAAERLSLRWDEGQGPREVEMTPQAREDEHLLFEAHLAASSSAVSYLFILPDGRPIGAEGGAGQSFKLSLRRLRPSIPEWWKEAVLYTIFIDRFRLGGLDGEWRTPPRDWLEDGRAAGDLLGVVEALDHLEELGVTALHLTPLWLSHSAHRYDAVDPRKVDPALGGEDGLARLLEAAHGRGMKVLLDLAVTHVHRDFYAFQDVRNRGPASPYWWWFRIARFPFVEGYEPGYDHYQKGQWEEPMLRTDNPEVVEYLVGTFERWTRFGADGFRVDAAADVPLGLLRQIGDAVRAINSEAVVYGEVIPEHLHRYLSHGLDAATDFPSQELLYDWLLRRRIGGRALAQGLRRRRFSRGGAGYRAICFTATHDQHRLLTLTDDPHLARLAHLLVLTRPEIPAIYAGDEVGQRAGEASRQFEGAWPDRQRFDWDQTTWDHETLTLVRRALAARRESPALRLGDLEPLQLDLLDGDPSEMESPLAYRRQKGEDIVDVILHAGDRPITLALAPDAPSGARTLVTTGEVSLDSEQGRVTLGPRSGVVLAREPSSETTQAFADLLDRNRELALQAFRQGGTELLALPSSLYLTVTEVCNLRCAHCLTHAPALTREGRARQMRPWVLDALRQPLAAAEYVGFSHGGESLTSPFFFEVLAALREIRGDRPGRTQVHLLTNGMLLDAEMARRLIDHGVTSLAFSLDGASAATNDAMRRGCRFETVLANLRETLALRERLSADLRIGISFVVGRWNVDELPALGALAADLGLDWVKVEEMFPATLQARHELIAHRAPELIEGVARLRQVLDEEEIVLVDHLDPPDGCWCAAALRPEVAVFRQADDFANRARFNPCRAAWEQLCVDPDGTLHLVDYDHPALGNLMEQSFLDLWNGPVARQIRAEALRRVPAELRCACQDSAPQISRKLKG
jgi:glycosidase/MoaA/NifB/PqqE/SkfB family radical SAM enzyme